MITGKYIENSKGEFIGFKYDNGFTFKGEFDSNRNPCWGYIYNPEGEEIYNGQIIGDIFEYFVEYLELSIIKQRPIIPPIDECL